MQLCNNNEFQYQFFSFLVAGTVPNWISGTYIRVGPGKFDVGDTTMTNFIDGYAILTKFDIRNGLVSSLILIKN